MQSGESHIQTGDFNAGVSYSGNVWSIKYRNIEDIPSQAKLQGNLQQR
jgi:hypothetical protein